VHFRNCLPGKLRLEEHILDATPGIDPLIFDSVGTTRESNLSRSVDEGVMGFSSTASAETLGPSEKK
jgi:hypothetical protein